LIMSLRYMEALTLIINVGCFTLKKHSFRERKA
jgi:hypothetical protein